MADRTLTGKELAGLGTKDAFNRTLRHIVNVTSLVDAVSKGANAADLLNGMVEQGVIERSQIPPIISVVLINKMELPFISRNLSKSVTDFSKVQETFARWTAVNATIIYHHPNVGVMAINPANPNHWDVVHELKVNELLIFYAHSRRKPEKSAAAVDAFFKLLDGQSVEDDPDFIEPQKAAPTPAPAAPRPAPAAGGGGGKKTLTPKYSVQVTNELFHNGNVEAWKNVIESYETAIPGIQVIVYHEGELIQDLNALFKWGKVKHGGLIMFQVAGTKIKGVSRLQKYLFEAASPRFEAFMKHDVNKVLNLF